ncbi:MAG: acetylglutamate kinase [Bacteroidota bacterium]|nr:acetylglutamate kinase [Bacteroidota bacterium]
MKKLYIIAISGNIMDDQEKLNNFLLDFSQLRGNKILVHGGGNAANQICEKLDVEPLLTKGKRGSDQNTLKVITMVYAGLINKNIVARLQSNQCNAIGLTGMDANIIPTLTNENDSKGFSGQVDSNTINISVINALLEKELIPVLAPISHDGKGNLTDINPDTLASELAVSFTDLYEVQLIYCFEKKGVLKDISDANSVIPVITLDNYHQLKKEGVIAEGMTPKLDRAFNALDRKVKSVRICAADKLLNTVNSPERVGTELFV